MLCVLSQNSTRLTAQWAHIYHPLFCFQIIWSEISSVGFANVLSRQISPEWEWEFFKGCRWTVTHQSIVESQRSSGFLLIYCLVCIIVIHWAQRWCLLLLEVLDIPILYCALSGWWNNGLLLYNFILSTLNKWKSCFDIKDISKQMLEILCFFHFSQNEKLIVF